MGGRLAYATKTLAWFGVVRREILDVFHSSLWVEGLHMLRFTWNRMAGRWLPTISECCYKLDVNFRSEIERGHVRIPKRKILPPMDLPPRLIQNRPF